MPYSLIKDGETAESFALLTTSNHDTRGITPLHVTVIDAIAPVIEVNPKNTHLDLAAHVSIASLDSLCDDNGKENVLAFSYDDFGADLVVTATSRGDVSVYQRE